jgi:hypothetical protein
MCREGSAWSRPSRGTCLVLDRGGVDIDGCKRKLNEGEERNECGDEMSIEFHRYLMVVNEGLCLLRRGLRHDYSISHFETYQRARLTGAECRVSLHRLLDLDNRPSYQHGSKEQRSSKKVGCAGKMYRAFRPDERSKSLSEYARTDHGRNSHDTGHGPLQPALLGSVHAPGHQSLCTGSRKSP